MDKYVPRKIEFKELLEVEGWRIKVYTITKDGDFTHPQFYENVKGKLPEWLSSENSFDASNDKIGFLILHAGTEGIFSLINWWVGKNMLNTHIFITNPEEPEVFSKISGDGLSSCIWELEVIYHERSSWIRNALKKEPEINYQSYIDDVYNGIV